jgi:hypothetical protein
MPLLGSAAVAMWWDVAPAQRAEFEDWHSHEHFPERMGIPGFQRGSRWAPSANHDGFFVIYELDTYETLTSPHYLARLNSPTPWSTKMMPHHRNMVRSQCRVLESHGSAIARDALTVRLAPIEGRDALLRDALHTTIARLVKRPGISGAHLLQHHRPAIAATTEQKLRGGDREAEWVLVVVGYDATALNQVAIAEAGAALVEGGVAAGAQAALYTLSTSATPTDVA